MFFGRFGANRRERTAPVMDLTQEDRLRMQSEMALRDESFLERLL
jgi:hypothetical protein